MILSFQRPSDPLIAVTCWSQLQLIDFNTPIKKQVLCSCRRGNSLSWMSYEGREYYLHVWSEHNFRIKTSGLSVKL